MEKIKVVSLFCGCGGTDVGIIGGFKFNNKNYSKNNVEIVYANDNDKKISEIFNKNFPIQVDIADIKDISSKSIPEHDILTGGFPCQSFSIVAQNPKRIGYKDEKGKLFFEMIRILKSKKPKAFIAENVKGILSANNREAFPLIIKEFKKSGYEVTWSLLNSANYGVPQKRERVFIVGIRKDLNVKYDFPPIILNESDFVKLREIIDINAIVDEKYYFSEKAVKGLMKSNKKMNKGRIQSFDKPCNTLGAHLAKVSLNSTDPVLKIDGKYRRFTPREVATIQSFPEKFKIGYVDSISYKALGNAIPPVLMWHVAKKLLSILNAKI